MRCITSSTHAQHTPYCVRSKGSTRVHGTPPLPDSKDSVDTRHVPRRVKDAEKSLEVVARKQASGRCLGVACLLQLGELLDQKLLWVFCIARSAAVERACQTLLVLFRRANVTWHAHTRTRTHSTAHVCWASDRQRNTMATMTSIIGLTHTCVHTARPASRVVW